MNVTHILRCTAPDIAAQCLGRRPCNIASRTNAAQQDRHTSLYAARPATVSGHADTVPVSHEERLNSIMYNILVCDDEKDIISALRIYLEDEGYRVFCASDGREAMEVLAEETVHLVLMDIMMPNLDGLSALSEIRRNYNIPVILISAKSEDTDIIDGMNGGADDYITKPFNPAVVLARVRSQLRRYMDLGCHPADPDSQSVLRIGGIALDPDRGTVEVDGREVPLTRTEFDILCLLMRRHGEVLSPKDIYRGVWHDDPYGAGSTVAVHIRHIREKIEASPAEPRYIKVVWGRGYKIDDSLGA